VLLISWLGLPSRPAQRIALAPDAKQLSPGLQENIEADGPSTGNGYGDWWSQGLTGPKKEQSSPYLQPIHESRTRPARSGVLASSSELLRTLKISGGKQLRHRARILPPSAVS
jgi:hypothetical protein